MNKYSVLSNKELLQKHCLESSSAKEVLDKFGLRAAGGNYGSLKRLCKSFGIEIPKPNRSAIISKTCGPYVLSRKRSDDEVFVANSSYSNRSLLKKRLLSKGFPYVCGVCKMGDTWNGSKLSLQLDHINGIYNDHRIENLRFICPNCHSQTETFCGKHTKAGGGTSKRECLDCGRKISRRSNRCRLCSKPMLSKSKIPWPKHENLVKMVLSTSKLSVGKILGVSDVAVHQRLLRGDLPSDNVLPLDDP